VARPCLKTISPRHGFVVEAVPTVNGWDWFSEAPSYAAVLDCTYEMTLDLVAANAITPAAAVAKVMVDENWKVLPTHVKAIIKRVEEG
jgi:hypothetical protein